MGYTLLMVARCISNRGLMYYVQLAILHYCYDELGTLKLINVLINPAVAFGYLQQMEDCCSLIIPRSAPPAMAGWRRRTHSYCRGTGGKIFSPALRAADNTHLQKSLFSSW